MNMQTLQCTIHQIRWETPDGKHVNCPMCVASNIEKLTKSLKEVTEHRDLLLKAIDIKLSVAAESLR